MRQAQGTTVGDLIEQIRADNTSGAAELERRGIQALRLAADAAADAEDPVGALWELGRKLLEARPSMAPFVAIVNEALSAAEAGASSARKRLDALERGLQAAQDEIERLAVDLLPPSATVVTVSRSSTVEGCLRAAARAGKSLRIVCPESRPTCEGVALARNLAEAGAQVAVCADAAACGLVGEADLVLVGADAVRRDGFVNKIGTYGLALAAAHDDVPFYVACGTDKWLAPACEHWYRILDRDPAELVEQAPPGVSVMNRYFESTPLELATGFITEHAVLAPRDVAGGLGSTAVHPLLNR